MYAVGIDLAEPATTWARATSSTATDAEGAVTSVVYAAADGSLQVVGSGDGPASEMAADLPADPANGLATDFVTALGSSEPVIVSGTPYGVEALIACVLAAVVEASAAEVGAQPDVVALVHDDDLDAYSSSLLEEAARVAGIPSDRLMLVPRSGAGERAAAGAAQLGFASLPESPVESGGGVGDTAAVTGGLALGTTAGVVGAAGAVDGASVLGAEVGGPGVASVAGPSGSSIGPSGFSTGPGGSAIGPTGTSVGPSGAGGVAGPAGATAAGKSWIPMAIAGAAMVLVAVGAVVVFAGGDDAPPDEVSAGIAVDTTLATAPTVPAGSVIEPSVPDTTADTEPSTTLNPDIDLSAYIGNWELCQASTTSPTASAAVRYSFAPAGPNQLTIDYSVFVFVDAADCSTAGIASGVPQTYTIDIVGESVVDGIPAVQATAPGAAWLMGVDGDTLRYGSSPIAEGFPTAFDPVSVYSRRL